MFNMTLYIKKELDALEDCDESPTIINWFIY